MTEGMGNEPTSDLNSVYTQRAGGAVQGRGCLFCGAELRPPAKAGRPVKFCKGNRCRSAWHTARKRQIIADIKARLVEIERLAEGLR